ncbi:MAG: hypothetical protein E6Q97_14645 [Desulfurellales bacterium]|nr:MAG: hypothetical protein E6Q97_14645 [Desulfurellales bacterium]
MTEAEYIQTIRDAAAAYIRSLDQDSRHAGPRGAARRWRGLMDTMSPHTMLALCERWVCTNGGK